MAPPMLLDDARKSAPRTHPSGDYSDNDLRYEGRDDGFKPFGAETIIPDDSFGPDEERIFIEDDPYDLDAAFFAIHNEDAPKVTEGHESQGRKTAGAEAPGAERGVDYVEESLINTKRRDKGAVDNYLRNQRGTEFEAARTGTTKSEERSKNAESLIDKWSKKRIEKKSGHFEDSTGDGKFVATESTSDEASREGVAYTETRYTEDGRDAEVARETSRIFDDRTSTTSLPEVVGRKEGNFKVELTLDGAEDDESYDGELSREKITGSRDNNQTESVAASEDRKTAGARRGETWDSIGNETTREDSGSGGAEVTREEDLAEEVEKPRLAVVETRDAFGKDANESTATFASLAFEENSNETAVAGSISVFSRGMDISFRGQLMYLSAAFLHGVNVDIFTIDSSPSDHFVFIYFVCYFFSSL